MQNSEESGNFAVLSLTYRCWSGNQGIITTLYHLYIRPLPKITMHLLVIDTVPHIRQKMAYVQERLAELPGVVSVKEPRLVLARLQGEKDVRERLQKAVADFCPFNIDVKGIGVFPHDRHVKTVWAGAPGLQNLQSAIGQEFGPPDAPAHSVIAMVKSGKVKEDVLKHVRQLENHNFGSMRVDKIIILARQKTGQPWDEEGCARLE